MIDPKVIKQLKSKDANKRRQAIGMLADSREMAALKHLEDIAQNDPDEKLRKLAVRAQDHLRKQVDKSRQRANAVAAGEASSLPVTVTEKDSQRARAFTEEALSMYIEGDNAKAAQRLVKALEANPNLKNDNYFLGIAGNVLEVPQEHALTVLADGGKRADFISQSRRGKVEKRKKKHRETAEVMGWSSVSFDLGIYGVVVAVTTFLMPFVFTQLIGRAIEYQTGLTVEELAQESVQFGSTFSDLNQWLSGVGIVVFLVAALVLALLSIVGMLIYTGALHLIATKMLRGVGTMPFMLSKVVPFYSTLTGIMFIWSIIAMALSATGAALIGGICMLPLGLVVLYQMFRLGGRIGEAYDFGAGKGCMTLIVANIIIGLISTIPGLIAQNLIAQAILNSLGAA